MSMRQARCTSSCGSLGCILYAQFAAVAAADSVKERKCIDGASARALDDNESRARRRTLIATRASLSTTSRRVFTFLRTLVTPKSRIEDRYFYPATSSAREPVDDFGDSTIQ